MFYSVTCKNADCGKRFKIRGPLKPGVHKVGCPFCSKKMSVRINAEEPEESEPKPKQPAARAASTEQTRKKFEAKLSSLHASYVKKQTALKETYDKKRAALKNAFDTQRSANEAEYAKAKTAVEAEMKAALSSAKQAAAQLAAEQQRKAEEQKRLAQMKAKLKDFSTAPPKALGKNIETGKEGIKATCPHCGQEFGMPKQDKPGDKQIKCPKCKGAISVKYTQPHIMTVNYWDDVSNLTGGMMQPGKSGAAKPADGYKPVPMPTTPKPKVEKPYLLANHKDTGRQLRFVPDDCGRPLGSPENIGVSKSTEKVYLSIGSNTIGRYDPMTPSDISIDGRYDSRMSRCSTCIEVTQTPHGFKFALILKNTKNPVLCNGLVMVPNRPYPINYGADIIMGETRFKLMCDM